VFGGGIDVRAYRSAPGGRDYWTLVTCGMSDVEMSVPAGVNAPKRVELIFYCSEPKDEYVDTLRWLSHFPEGHKTWVGPGYTIPNGNPPKPLWGCPGLDTILLLPTFIARPDGTSATELSIAGDSVHFLWVVPATAAECGLKHKRGLDAILDLFARHRHPHVFDAGRKGYV
jgi:hypothetical protein